MRRGSIHYQELCELVQLYGANRVREAVAEIVVRGEVTDPAAARHRSNVTNPEVSRWHGAVYRIGGNSGHVWSDRVTGSIGCRGLLQAAGILTKAE